MGDSTINKIDNLFNVVDATLDEAGKFIDRVGQSGKAAGKTVHKVRDVVREARDANPKPTAPAPSGAKPTPSVKSNASTSRVRIIESIDAQTGKPVFVVTDGVSRSECSSRALADRVARAMEVE